MKSVCVREDGKEAGRQDVESIVCPTMKRSSRQEACGPLNGGINIWGQRAAVCVSVRVSECVFVALDETGFSGFFLRLGIMQMSVEILQPSNLVFRHISCQRQACALSY